MIKQITLSVLLSTASIASLEASNVGEFLKPANIKKEIKEEVADLDIGASVPLLDADLGGAVGFSTKYKYEVEPSHNEGFYTRVDKWRIKVDLKPGDLIGGSASPLYFNISKGSSVYFIRQFKEQKDALKAKPYTFKKLPLTAKQAIEYLQPGDLVQIPTQMSLAFGLSSNTIPGNNNSGASIIKSLNGQFFVNIFRMKDNHARVRIVSKKVSNRNLGAGAGLEFDIFGIRLLDNYVERIFETDLAKIGFGKQKGQQFIVDYILDLDDEKAAKAYDQMLSSAHKFKDLEVMKEYIKKRGLENRLFKVFQESEDLAKEDALSENKRAQLVFKGFNNFKGKDRSLKLGAIITSFQKSTTFRKNILSEEKADGTSEKFTYQTLTTNIASKFGVASFGTKEKANKTIFSLFSEKIASSKNTQADIGFVFNIKDEDLTKREQKYLDRDLRMNLPTYAKKDLKWSPTSKKMEKANIKIEVYIKAEALENIEKVSWKAIRKKFTEAMKKYEREGKTFGEVGADVIIDTASGRNVNEFYERKRSAKTLEKVLFGKYTTEERADLMMTLKKNTVFKKVGFSVIMSMISSTDQQDFTYSNVKVSEKGVSSVQYESSEDNTPNVYRQLKSLQNIVDGNSYSMYY